MTLLHCCVVGCVLTLICLLTAIGHLLQSRHYQTKTLFDPGTFPDGNPTICIVDLRGQDRLQREFIEAYGHDLSPAALIVSGIPDESLVRFVRPGVP